MVSLASRFDQLAQAGEKALVLFVTAGDPSLQELPEILSFLAEAGADVIEVGIPFSDPIADGPVIQASSQRALERGVTPGAVLESLSRVQVPIPIVAMGYYNPILRNGLAQSAADFREAGVAGTIISDLTPEESDEWIACSRAHDLETVFLAAPTSTDARLVEVGKRSSGFLYAVSRTGVTGASQSAGTTVHELVDRIRPHTRCPICVGFGVSKPEQVREISQFADGVVVGSWLVDALKNYGSSRETREIVEQHVKLLKEATKP